jgi:hypothetical protein
MPRVAFKPTIQVFEKENAFPKLCLTAIANKSNIFIFTNDPHSLLLVALINLWKYDNLYNAFDGSYIMCPTLCR